MMDIDMTDSTTAPGITARQIAQDAPTIDPSVLINGSSSQVMTNDAANGPSHGGDSENTSAITRNDKIALHSTSSDQKPRNPSGALLRTGLCYDPLMRLHTKVDDNHPEDPRRIGAIYDMLFRGGLVHELNSSAQHSKDLLHRIPARRATREEIELVHTPAHFAFIKSTKDADPVFLHDLCLAGDSVYYNNYTYTCARLAVGGAIESSKAVVSGVVKNAIAVIRPPGHHAVPTESQGFCIFNNVCVAARLCQQIYRSKCRKILIFDWDVHHGNGIQDIFYQDPNVLYMSIHVHENGKFYPCNESANHLYCGEGLGIGKNVNVPWTTTGMGNAEYVYAFNNVIMPIALEFDPDLVIISAGFDAAEGDDMGCCFVTPECYAYMTHLLMSLAGGKVVVCLEGGYNLDSISRCAFAVTRALMGEPLDRLKMAAPAKIAIEDVERVKRRQSPYWHCMSAYKTEPTMPIKDGERLHDVIRTFQYRKLAEERSMIKLYVLNKELSKLFNDQVIASSNYMDAKTLIFIFHDPPEVFGTTNPRTNKLETHNSWLLDVAAQYIAWCQKQGYAVIDVNIPHRLTDLDDQQPRPDNEEDLPSFQAMKKIVLYMWDNYIQISRATNVFFIGVGNAHAGILHLLASRDFSSLVKGVINLLSGVSVRAIKRDIDPDLPSWYYKNSLVYVNASHSVWAEDRKPPKRKFGRVIKSDENDINAMLARHMEDVTGWIAGRVAREG